MTHHNHVVGMQIEGNETGQHFSFYDEAGQHRVPETIGTEMKTWLLNELNARGEDTFVVVFSTGCMDCDTVSPFASVTLDSDLWAMFRENLDSDALEETLPEVIARYFSWRLYNDAVELMSRPQVSVMSMLGGFSLNALEDDPANGEDFFDTLMRMLATNVDPAEQQGFGVIPAWLAELLDQFDEEVEEEITQE